ncbi:sigma-70 family RNA polymerase sigma factor [Frigoribacterium sp. CFBP9030]|uniref:sigma-70 family RNA polymerase sigma factor n=1 Tax=Frigoribacterium sp. CFBP9030 TaxID=3096537 RepID=UPI002A6A456A|nr:sigma-70 family RNA polymerase sigma factor [Frigoribacterium sp. CFBP9030]MDY0893245.1 sigma-70 family RNA polymerase sigma factor [Frigoribacterium sp. CFBP9030]
MTALLTPHRHPTAERSPMTAPPSSFDVDEAFAEHGSALLGFAVNALGDRGQAEDCVQETFLRAWRARDRFDPTRASARTWLFAIERRLIIDVLRARQRTPHLVTPDDAPDASTNEPDPLDRLGLVEGLARLSDEHRAAVVAVHLRGRTYRDVSESTGVPVATLRTRVHYALRALRTHLDEGDTTDD